MEQPNSFFKNSRNQKRKDDKRKKDKQRGNYSNENEIPSQSNVESKPQRANRRQRVEPPLMPAAAGNEENTVTEKKTESTDTDQEVKEEPIIDHSHLKRETEEIAKLTQKNYSRRQVTSNWERYIVPATDEIPIEEEISGAADFSTLLQTPRSYGGHLKLKEEKNWGAESEAILNSYLALDLNVLAQGLACIPFYERHELSVDLFSKDELEQMEAASRNNVELYKAMNHAKSEHVQLQTRNINDNILKILTQKEEPSKDSFGLTDSIIGMDNKNNFAKIESSFEKINYSIADEKELSNKIQSNPTPLENSTLVHNLENVITFRPNSDTPVAFENRNLENESSTKVDLQRPPDVNKISEDSANSICLESTELNSGFSSLKTVTQLTEEKSTCKVSPSVIKPSRMDDDEELDFLLSLKPPIKEIAKPEKAIVDTSVSMGGVCSPETVTTTESALVQKSELDDWLDSVLND